MQQVWDRYWSTQTSTNSFQHEYGQTGPLATIADFWRQQAKAWQDDEIIVDLAAGNGALASLFPSRHKRWINIDLAHTVTDHGLTVRADLQALPLRQESVQQIVSMFGCEYADPKLFVEQLKTVLKNSGNFTAICHHQDSIVTLQSLLTRQVYKQVFESQLSDIDSFKGMTRQAIEQTCLQVLTNLLQGLPSKYQQDVKIIGNQYFNLLQQSADVNAIIANMHFLYNDLCAHDERLQQQIAAAQNSEVLRQRLQLSFTQVDAQPLYFDKAIIGWHLNTFNS